MANTSAKESTTKLIGRAPYTLLIATPNIYIYIYDYLYYETLL